MTIQERMNRLEHDYVLNFEQPYYENNLRLNTDTFIVKAMNLFLINFKKEIALKHNIVLLYQNDIYSYFAYKIVKNALISLKKDNKFFILGDLSKEEKNLFKKETIVKKFSSKRKKSIVITGFNPIYNVIDLDKLSKKFDVIYHPLQTMPHFYVEKMIEYYIPDKSCLLKSLKNNIDELTSDYYKSQITIEDDSPFVCYELSGTKEDFPTYNYILQHQDKINLYVTPPEIDRIKFIRDNLGFYIMGRNFPNEFNIVSMDIAKQICDYNKEKNNCFFQWTDFSGDEQ